MQRTNAAVNGVEVKGRISWSNAHTTLANVTTILAKTKGVVIGVPTNRTANRWSKEPGNLREMLKQEDEREKITLETKEKYKQFYYKSRAFPRGGVKNYNKKGKQNKILRRRKTENP